MSTINWPAILNYSGDAELLYLNSQSEWDSDQGLHSFSYDENDCLIDSSGNIYSLIYKIDKTVQPVFTNKTKTLDEILGLIKAHASQTDSCCVAKLYAPSISDAFKMIEALSTE